MGNNSVHPFRLLPYHRLDKDVQKIVQPFNFILSVFFSSKFKIRDGYITPCDKNYPIVLFLLVSIFNTFWIYNDISRRDIHTSAYMVIFWICYMFSCISHVVLVISSIFHSQTHISLIIKIQEINRSIDVRKKLLSYIICNWISISSIIFVFILDCSTYYSYVPMVNLTEVSEVLLVAAFDFNLVYGIRLMELLRIYLDEWVHYVMILNNNEENEEYCRKLFVLFQNILEAYKLYKTCFQLSILWRTIDVFFRSLFYVEAHLLVLQKLAATRDKALDWVVTSIITAYIVKNVSLVMLSCRQCEKFYMSMEEADSACIQRIMNKNCSESHKHLCKRVLQVNRTFSKMTACGLFTVDATLPIPLAGLMTNYILVLLQFTLL